VVEEYLNYTIYRVGKVIIHTEKRDLQRERMERHLSLTPEERFHDLVKLCMFSMKMAGRKTIGDPQGKGLVVRKKSIELDGAR
jgi:hypothetical protein